MCDDLDLLFTIFWWWKSENSAVAPFHCSGPVSQDGTSPHESPPTLLEKDTFGLQIAGPPLSHMFFCTCCKKNITLGTLPTWPRTRDVCFLFKSRIQSRDLAPLSPRGHWGLGCCRRMSRTISSLSWTSVRSPPRIEKSDWWIDEWKIPMGNTHLVAPILMNPQICSLDIFQEVLLPCYRNSTQPELETPHLVWGALGSWTCLASASSRLESDGWGSEVCPMVFQYWLCLKSGKLVNLQNGHFNGIIPRSL